jgi:carbonic anhydrase/acetyltransferase-like protein (isoleucine patch superfamily)
MSRDSTDRSVRYIAPNATVIGDVTLGDEVSVWFGAVIRADKDSIAIGRCSNVQDNAVIHTSSGYPVRLGAFVSVGHGAILHGCTVEDRVLVGMGAVVMNGAIVGSDTIIGAGAVITEGARIPQGSVVLGVPGRVVKQTTGDQQSGITKNATSYWHMAEKYLHG